MFIYICEDCNSKFVEMHVDASDIYPSALVFYTRQWVNITIYPAMTAFTDQYSLPNNFFDIGQL